MGLVHPKLQALSLSGAAWADAQPQENGGS